MRIAVSGAHRTGKTTLIVGLARALPTYAVADEPYHLLEEEGHVFPEMPSLEDFELQLERSIDCVLASAENQLFDRCPADILAYLASHRDADGFDVEPCLPRLWSAMQLLDQIVFVPIEAPDRVILSGGEDGALRRRVDEELRTIVLEDRWGFGVEAMEVRGPAHERVHQVLAHVGRGRP
jgi:predicted ATPase